MAFVLLPGKRILLNTDSLEAWTGAKKLKLFFHDDAELSVVKEDAIALLAHLKLEESAEPSPPFLRVAGCCFEAEAVQWISLNIQPENSDWMSYVHVQLAGSDLNFYGDAVDQLVAYFETSPEVVRLGARELTVA